MLRLSILRSLHQLQNSVSSLTHSLTPKASIDSLTSTLPTSKYTNSEIFQIIHYLDAHITSLATFPSLSSALIKTYKENSTAYDTTVLSSLYWFLRRKGCTDEKTLTEIQSKLEAQTDSVDSSSLSYFIQGLTFSHNKPRDETILAINQTIIRLKGRINAKDLGFIAKGYMALYSEETENVEVFYTIESEMFRMIKDMHIMGIIHILYLMSRISLKYPTDIFTMIEPRLVKNSRKYPPSIISKIISIYCTLPISYHYRWLYTVLADVIVERQKEFFADLNSIANIAHCYSKFHEYPHIMQLFPKNFPELPQKLLSDHKSLGYFIYAMMRRPPNQDYEKMITKVLFSKYKDISELTRKKIVICMLKRNASNEEFWKNVKDLRVRWKTNELVYVNEHRENLQKYDLIED